MIALVMFSDRLIVFASGCLLLLQVSHPSLYDAVPMAGALPVDTLATSLIFTGSPPDIFIRSLKDQ